MLGLFAPYALPTYHTLRLGRLVKSLAENEEAPFGAESSRLLREFQYGVIDNAGNLVLLKHPLDVRSRVLPRGRKAAKMAMWNIMPHRTRFELSKPSIPAKATREARLPGGLQPAGAIASFIISQPAGRKRR